jgi:anti-sigma factor RsiW
MASNSDCRFAADVAAYHDGQLDAARRQAFAAHLDSCPVCRAELAELASLSGFFASAPRPRLSPIDVHRLQVNVLRRAPSDILRLARVLSGIAACIVVGGSIELARSNSAPAVAPALAPPWAEVTSSVSDLRDAATPAAQWYLADASRSSEDAP